MICSASALRSSGRSGGRSSACRSPLMRSTGARPTLRCRSEAFCWIMCCSTALKLNGAPDDVGVISVAPGAGAAVLLAIGIHPEKDLSVLHGMRILDGHLAHDARVL